MRDPHREPDQREDQHHDAERPVPGEQFRVALADGRHHAGADIQHRDDQQRHQPVQNARGQHEAFVRQIVRGVH
jgi:hypothetical protein